MSSQDLTQVAREIITGYSTANWTALKGLFTPNAIYNELGSQRRIQGADSIIQTLQGWKKTMTDSKGKVTSAFASGDAVVMQITWTGTQDGTFTGPAGEVPPTGKRQTTPAAMIVKFRGNKISEIDHYFDMLTFLQQIGAMPAAIFDRQSQILRRLHPNEARILYCCWNNCIRLICTVSPSCTMRVGLTLPSISPPTPR